MQNIHLNKLNFAEIINYNKNIDNVNFYHYPSYISLAKSSLPKLLTYLILNFYLTFVNKYILGYIDLSIPLIPIFMSFL